MLPANLTVSFRTSPRSVHISGGPSRAVYTAEDVELARKQGESSGVVEVKRVYEAKLTELKAEIAVIQNQSLQSIASRFDQALTQMRALLPQLVVEATARVVAGIPVEADMVRRVVEDLLSEVAPGSDRLEVQLCEVDLKMMEQYQPQFRQKFPALEFFVNPELKSGDCMVKTRFGILDGRIETKLRGLTSLLN